MANSGSTLPADAHLSFEEMARFYDLFTAHHDYELWFSHLLPALAAHGQRGPGRLLDVGCGTGKSFLPMLGRGWEVTACDLSESMVERARRKAGGEARLAVADMRELPAFGEFDLVWALDDAVNYLSDEDELAAALGGMAANLAGGGLLAFDVNTLLTYRTFYVETDERELDGWRLRWRGRSAPDLLPGSLFEADFEVEPAGEPGGEATVVSAATHRQRHFLPGQVREALARAGLECLGEYGIGFDAAMRRPLDEALHTKAIFIARSAPRSLSG
jgi:SAM-dependent methyltransferase